MQGVARVLGDNLDNLRICARQNRARGAIETLRNLRHNPHILRQILEMVEKEGCLVEIALRRAEALREHVFVRRVDVAKRIERAAKAIDALVLVPNENLAAGHLQENIERYLVCVLRLIEQHIVIVEPPLLCWQQLVFLEIERMREGNLAAFHHHINLLRVLIALAQARAKALKAAVAKIIQNLPHTRDVVVVTILQNLANLKRRVFLARLHVGIILRQNVAIRERMRGLDGHVFGRLVVHFLDNRAIEREIQKRGMWQRLRDLQQDKGLARAGSRLNLQHPRLGQIASRFDDGLLLGREAHSSP